MIDPINLLAFSMHANKGVYALLLGSGISRAARIPTGWEITLDLTRKVAALQKEDCESDPAAWLYGKTGEQPDYSTLLNMVAKTPAERQQLLRSYLEPTEEEREEAAKLPTKAHRAIADLVKLGYIRVLLTTNFDRLMELALQDRGIQPTVLSSPDHINGAMPLIHTACTIIKINGDYLDTRIKNTPEELANYSEEFDHLLDCVFDEFGLIISGWSADWDVALRKALIRTKNRRFSTFWASRGEPSEQAKALINHRGATLVNVADANTFFTMLGEQVKALEEFSRPHPLSTEAAVSMLKKYLSESKYRIVHNDLVTREVDDVVQTMASDSFDLKSKDMTSLAVLNRLKKYEAASTTLIRMGFVAGQWSDGNQVTPWADAVAKLSLGLSNSNSGISLWRHLQRYPATLLLYAFGLGTVAGERWQTLKTVLNMRVFQQYNEDKRVVQLVPICALFDKEANSVMKILPGRQTEWTPLNNQVEELLWEQIGTSFPSKLAFEFAFDKLEILLSIFYYVVSEQGTSYGMTLPGIYGWRKVNNTCIFEELRRALKSAANTSPLFSSGLLGSTAAAGLESLNQFEHLVDRVRWNGKWGNN